MSPVFMPGYLDMMTPAIDASEAYAKAALWQFWESALDKVDLAQYIHLHTYRERRKWEDLRQSTEGVEEEVKVWMDGWVGGCEWV